MEQSTNEKELKITWGEFKARCEKAGIKDDDTLDSVHVTWGPSDALQCKFDADFGWQIVLDCDC